MKALDTLLISLILATMPITVAAQKAIKSAFDTIITCPDAKISQSHSLEKDPETKIKTSQSDIYRFELPASREILIRNVLSAFGKESDTAYNISQGKDEAIQLAIGDGNSSVALSSSGYDYIYALFLSPSSEDKEGKYRYAYGMSYTEEKGKISGILVITYATTLKYRQENGLQKTSQFDRITSDSSPQNRWFGTMMSYLQGMMKASPQTRIALAGKAFKLIQTAQDDVFVTKADKNAVREILKGMISDPEYSETVLNTLLNQCLIELK